MRDATNSTIEVRCVSCGWTTDFSTVSCTNPTKCPQCKGKIVENLTGEQLYINVETGIIDTRDGWYYEDENGNILNAVGNGDVVEL